MRKQFLRMFFSIMGIAVLILLILTFAFLYANYRSVVKWPNFVIGEYMNSIVTISKKTANVGPSEIISLLIEKIPDSISGLLIRDSEGNYNLMYGSSPRGKNSDKKTFKILNSSEDNQEISLMVSLDPKNIMVDDKHFTKKVNTFVLSINNIDALSIKVKDTGIQALEYVVPGFLGDRDIAGTVFIEYNGVVTGSFDVLIYGMKEFGPNYFILTELFRCFLFFIPVAIILAIVMAYHISKVNSRNTLEIKNCLYQMSKGDYNFSVPKMKLEEYNEIAQSINSLKEALNHNERMRHEWLLSISHDLNTPVTSLLMLYEGVQDKVFPFNEETLKMVKNEIDTLSSRINSISYYINLRLNNDANAQKVIEINSFLSNCAFDYPQLKVDITSTNPITIKVDDNLFIKAVNEAYKNCLEYSVDKTCKVEVLEQNHTVLVKFKNKGQIDTKRDDYFELWSRGDLSRTSGGSGLGLPTVKRIVELHKGTTKFYQEGDEVVLSIELPSLPTQA